FNPAMPWYVGMFTVGGLLLAAFLVMGVVAAQSLRHPSEACERLAFRTAVRLACVCIVLQMACVAGSGLVSARYQPAKAAATTGYWQSGEQPDLVLFAWPDAATGTNRAAWLWRHAGGRWLGRDEQGALRGL